MTTIDLTISGADAKDLARILRAIARQIDASREAVGSANVIPPLGTTGLIYIEGRPVGELRAPGRLSLDDVANLASAERMGNIHTLASASDAIRAIVSSLRQEGTSSKRDGLLTGAEIVTAWLSERADFLRVVQEEGKV